MDKTRKISYQSLKEKLSDEKLKRIIAGSGGGSNSCCNCSDPDGEYPKDKCEMGGGCSVYYPDSCLEICVAWWDSELSCSDFNDANC